MTLSSTKPVSFILTLMAKAVSTLSVNIALSYIAVNGIHEATSKGGLIVGDVE